MDATLLGVVLDSGVLIAAERRHLTAAQAVESVQRIVGEIPLVLCALTVSEIGHGIYRADSESRRNQRRAFLDELKATIPIQPVTADTAEIVARIGGEQAARGISLPLADLLIGATAVELGYAVATGNLRDFSRIPGLRVVQL